MVSSDRLIVAVEPAEKSRWDAEARKAGISTSEFLRRAADHYDPTAEVKITLKVWHHAVVIHGDLIPVARFERLKVGRTPRVDKKSREMFEVRTYKRLLDLIDPATQSGSTASNEDSPAEAAADEALALEAFAKELNDSFGRMVATLDSTLASLDAVDDPERDARARARIMAELEANPPRLDFSVFANRAITPS